MAGEVVEILSCSTQDQGDLSFREVHFPNVLPLSKVKVGDLITPESLAPVPEGIFNIVLNTVGCFLIEARDPLAVTVYRVVEDARSVLGKALNKINGDDKWPSVLLFTRGAHGLNYGGDQGLASIGVEYKVRRLFPGSASEVEVLPFSSALPFPLGDSGCDSMLEVSIPEKERPSTTW